MPSPEPATGCLIKNNAPNSIATKKVSRLRSDTLASSVLILMVATLLQRSVGFGRGILFCRWLSPETLGQWDLTYSFLLLAAPLAVLGVPGSFGRYLEHFRQRGHLRTFLQRTTLWTAVCAGLTVGLVMWCAPWFSFLLFCNYDNVNLVRGIALCLAAIILHHTLTSLLTALRLISVVSAMNFAQSMLFAAFAIGLLCFDASVTSILLAYGVACLAASLGAILWVWPGLREIDRPLEPLPQRNFWPLLMRFAFFVWLTNLLSHLFIVIDRYMLMHYSGMSNLEAQIQIGHYHSSRIVPLLLVSFADLLSGLVMPHLSSDWEAGRRKQVGHRLNLSLKMAGLGMFGFGVCVLFFAPLLFDVFLQGKYSNGQIVLPWALSGCIWYGIFSLAQNYLWCDEKVRLAALPIAIGLLTNIVLNLLLMPLWGLYGAVAATAVASLVCLILLLLLSMRHGLPLDSGTWLIIIAPLAIAAGPAIAGVTLLVLTTATFGTRLILRADEHAQLHQLVSETCLALKPYLQRRAAASGNA